MSVSGSQETQAAMANGGSETINVHPDSIPVLPTININEMQPNVDKVVHVTKIFIVPNEPIPTAEEAAAASEAVNAEPPPVVIQPDGIHLAGSVVNVPTETNEFIPIQIQPTYPAAHPLPDVTADVNHPEKVGEIVPITIQPTYPLKFNAPDSGRTDDVMIPAYPASSVPAPEETVPTIRITSDLVRFGTIVTSDSASGSEASSSLGETLYPAAHSLPIVTAGAIDHDMKEIPLPPVIEPGRSNHTLGDHSTTNGPNDVHVTIQERNTSRRRGIILTLVLLVSVIVSFGGWSLYQVIIKNSPE